MTASYRAGTAAPCSAAILVDMSHYRNTLWGIFFLALSAPAAFAQADLILKNGRIWTGDPAEPWADAVAVRRNRIVAAGDNLQVAGLAGKTARVIDLGGRLAVPGFNDSHIHLMQAALRTTQADLTGACTVAELQKRVRDYAAAHPKDTWVTGSGWDESCFGNHAPGRADLDAVAKDRPVFLMAEDRHGALVNSRALQLAGLGKPVRYAGPGRVVIDGGGEPTGILDGPAIGLVRKLTPEISRERKLAALEQELRTMESFGITSASDLGGDEELLGLLDDLDRQHKLTVRVTLYLPVTPQTTPDAIDHIIELKQSVHSPRLRVAGVRMALDGMVDAHSAALLEPYADMAGSTGKLAWSQDGLNQMAALCDTGGLQIATHAAGDRAVHMALEAYESVRRANETHDDRFRVERAELVSPADTLKFARLGAIASVMPTVMDPAAMDGWSRAIGPQRLGFAFPWRSLDQAGDRLVFGSDWPRSASPDPLRAIHIAVTRESVDGRPKGGWEPAQRVSADTALRACTVNGAWATFDNRVIGKLRPGMLADIAVLSQDIFMIAPEQIWKTHVDMTMLDGQVVYSRQ